MSFVQRQSENRAFVSKLWNFYFDLRPPRADPRQNRVTKTRPQGQLECANQRGSPGGEEWSGLELTDTSLASVVVVVLPNVPYRLNAQFGHLVCYIIVFTMRH